MMADTVSQGQFFDTIQGLRDHIDAKHASQRSFIEERANRLEAKLDQHAKDDKSVEDRVLVIETQREGERADIIKRSAFLSALIAPVCIAVWQLLKKLLGLL